MTTDRAPEASAPGRSGRHRSRGRVSVPPRIAPGATTPRLTGLDLARGLAVLSMLVAHAGPTGGVLVLSEYLTAPLFVVVIGAAMGLALAVPGVDPVRFVADNVLRGVLLVALGVLLQAASSQIDVVLPSLGLLVIVLAPLGLALRHLPVLAVGVAAGAAVLGPLATERAREHLTVHAATTGAGTRDLLLWLAAGPTHRLVSFLPMAIGGLVLALVLPRVTHWRAATPVAAVLLATSGAVHALGAATPAGAQASSGTTAEVVAATFLAAGTVVAALALADAAIRTRATAAALSPVLAVGRLALTGYTLHVLVLVLVGAVRGGARDDAWPVLLLTTAVVVATCWLLDRTWGTGPLEVLVRAARPPAGLRPGSALREAVSAARNRRDPPAPRGSTPPEA